MSISFAEARHMVCQALGYDAELATTVLFSAMHSGQLSYGTQPIEQGDGALCIVTGLAPSEESVLDHDELRELIDSRRPPIPTDSEQAQPNSAASALDPREKKALLLVIGMLLQIVTDKVPGNSRKRVFNTQGDLAHYIAEKYEGYYGASVRALQDKFAAANKQLEES